MYSCLIRCLSGLTKPKKFDWKDSNLELFGSDVERKIKSRNYRKTMKLGFWAFDCRLIYNSYSHIH